MPDVTQILAAIESGDPIAASELLPLVYDELRKLAEARMRQESPDHTLEPTALVHEAYIRLVGSADPGWQNRAHFFAAAAEAMRRILIDGARRKRSHRHGGDLHRITLHDDELSQPMSDQGLLALDEALVRLKAHDPSAAEVVSLRFFAGLSVAEVAQLLNMSVRTTERNWTYARTWLRRELSARDSG